MKVAVVSGKGGSGKSSVSAAFAALAGNTVLVDCDVDTSNIPLLFPHEVVDSEVFSSGQEVVCDTDRCTGCGLCADSCRYGALRTGADGVAVTDGLLCEGCGLCTRLCPAGALSVVRTFDSRIYRSTFPYGLLVHGELNPGDDNSGRMIARLRELADEATGEGKAAHQILDGPPGIGCPVLSTVTGVDRVVVVCEPTLSGVEDLMRVCRVVSSLCGDLVVLVNKADVSEENRGRIHDFCREKGLEVVGELCFDRMMVDAQVACTNIVDYAPHSEIVKRLRSAYGRIFRSGKSR